MGRTVTVMRGSAVVEEIGERPIRLLPDRNTAGVVYRKVVYALRAAQDFSNSGCFIDLKDKSWDKDECPIAPAGRELCLTGQGNVLGLVRKSVGERTAPAVKWRVESNGYGHYLVFDGSRALLQQILQELRSEQTEVIRADECYRPADDGYQYDWFVRMPADQRSSAEVSARLSPLIVRAEGAIPSARMESVAPDSAPNTERMQDLLRRLQSHESLIPQKTHEDEKEDEKEKQRREQELLDLKARLRRLEAKSAADDIALRSAAADRSRSDELAEKLRVLESRNAERNEEFANLQRSHARLLQLLEHERSSAARAPSGENTSRLRQRVEDVQSELADFRDRLRASEDLLARERSSVQRLSGNEARLLLALREKEARVAHLESECRSAEEAWEETAAVAAAREREIASLSATSAQAARLPKAGPAFRRAIGCMATHCYPRLELSEDAVEEIVDRHLYRARQLWPVLWQVNDHRTERGEAIGSDLQWSRVKDRWFEVRAHISDGQQRQAVRIYFEPPLERSGKARVEIHWKSDDKDQQRVIESLGKNWKPFSPSEFQG